MISAAMGEPKVRMLADFRQAWNLSPPEGSPRP
jgi:hypothetical protein